MKLSGKHILYIILGIASWIPVVYINLQFIDADISSGTTATNTSFFQQYAPEIELFSVKVAFGIFFLLNTVAVRSLLAHIEKWEVTDLLWKLLVSGIAGISLSFLFQIIAQYNENHDSSFINEAYAISVSISLYTLLAFLVTAIYAFKKLILYQKNKRKVFLWRLFEGLLLLGLIRIFLPEEWQFTNSSKFILLPAFVIVSLFLSANVNWSAYLNFNQKLRSLFLIFVLSILCGLYYYTFPMDALPEVSGYFELLASQYLYLGLLFLFPAIYTLFSGLVLIFNLPTSSVFEQRSSELATVQRINQAIQSNLKIEDVLTTLLDASLLTSNADAGWVEVKSKAEGEKFEIHDAKNLSRAIIKLLRKQLSLIEQSRAEKQYQYIKNIRRPDKHLGQDMRIRSVLAIPITSNEEVIGTLVLVDELSAAFEDEIILSLVSLADQAGFAVENARRVRQSIEYERYSEQLKIAKEVQEEILPNNLPSTKEVEFFAVSQEVEEIGGDYYDIIWKDDRFKLALGDVSGKGITAAFYMAETKGIFQALTTLGLSPIEFIITANEALSNCLNKGFFMTLTYMEILPQLRQIELYRAGHCPSLFYKAATQKIEVLEEGGPGLAILRDGSFRNYIKETQKISYLPGDIMVLFTDGILEAHNKEKEEFGIDRICKKLMEMHDSSPQKIAYSLLAAVQDFCGGRLEDDYSILVIKFK